MDTSLAQILVFGGILVVMTAVVAYLNAREQEREGKKNPKGDEPKTLL